MASEAGNAAQTPFIPNSALNTSEQATMATITRAEVTAITNRLLDRAADEDYVDDHAGELRQFPDVSASYWAYHDIVEATNAHSYRVYDGEEHWM